MHARCKPIVFISYAREDEPERPAEGEIKWLSLVTECLGPAEQVGVFDMRIGPMTRVGDRAAEGARSLRVCGFFVPLVSTHALSSEYTLDQEIAIIRERQTRGEAYVIRPC
jgi:hypothetical protein